MEELINSIKSYLNQLQEEAKRKAEEEQRKLEIEKNKKEEEKNKKKQEQLINTIKLSCSTLNNQEEKLEIDRENLLLQTDEITDANLRDSLRQLIADGGCIHQKWNTKLNQETENLAQQIQQIENQLNIKEREVVLRDEVIAKQKQEIYRINIEHEQNLKHQQQADEIVRELNRQLFDITESHGEIERSKKNIQRSFLFILIPVIILLLICTIRLIESNSKIKELEEKELNNNYIGNQYKRDVNIKGHLVEMEY